MEKTNSANEIKLTPNILIKVLSYLPNKEIIASKLLSRQFYGLLSDPIVARACLDIEKPKLALNSIRSSISQCLVQKTELALEELKDSLDSNIGQVNLTTLNLNGLKIQNENIIKAIFGVLSKEEHYVDKIWLSNNNFGRNIINPFIEYLESCLKLKEVKLNASKLGKPEIEKVCGAMMKNESVRILDLSGNVIGASGAKYIAEMLNANRTLEVLYLQKTSLGKEGFILIMEALQSNISLRKLHIEDNKVNAKSLKNFPLNKVKIYI